MTIGHGLALVLQREFGRAAEVNNRLMFVGNFASRSGDCMIRVFDLRTGKERPLEGHRRAVTALQFVGVAA